jgi:hypothetical protein
LGLLIFVFMAGLELQPKRLRRLGMPIFWTSFMGILLPLAMGVGSVLLWPDFWRNQAQGNVRLLALFIGTILSISALPVIARILMDLNLIKTELGVIVMSAAMLDDLAGWGLFAVILSNFGGAGHSGRRCHRRRAARDIRDGPEAHAVQRGADRARQEGTVVVRVVPSKAALVVGLLPECGHELYRLDRLFRVEVDRLAVSLDFAAAP